MQITCLGAAGCVTGSCYLLDNGKQYLVDCGLFQGGKHMEALNRKEWGFVPRDIAALFLTHAHIDHCGRIPKLVRDGFGGKIYATAPTAELCKILLLDSAHIQEMEAEWQSRRNRRIGKHEVQPLYSTRDAEACFPLFEIVEPDDLVTPDPNLQVRFRNAGHILGSSILEVWCASPSGSHKTVFSGDIGQKGQLIVEDPHSVFQADTLFIESTYGNRNHRSFDESKQELLEAIHFSYERREKVLIPAFAVERTQELLYILGDFFRSGQIPSMPVYLDSPLAIRATEIFRQMKSFYDQDTMAVINQGRDPFAFPQLVYSKSTEQSMAINQSREPAIILAGNGMCTAGRIKHHLKHNLWRKGSSLVIVGFQAEGTLGRKLVEGAKTVQVFSERIAVRARIFTIGGFSAHADQGDLLEWLSHFENRQMKVYLVHGERSVSEDFARLVSQRLGFETHVPSLGERLEMAAAAEAAGDRRGHWDRRLNRLLQEITDLHKAFEANPARFSERLLDRFRADLDQADQTLDGLKREIRSN